MFTVHLFISNSYISSKLYYKHDDFDIVNFTFLDADIYCSTSYNTYISQLIRLQECQVILLTLTLVIKF